MSVEVRVIEKYASRVRRQEGLGYCFSWEEGGDIGQRPECSAVGEWAMWPSERGCLAEGMAWQRLEEQRRALGLKGSGLGGERS